MKAFYFSPENQRLEYSDNREIIVGETHTVDCEPICCHQGLHASEHVYDALQYAKSNHLYLVELSGEFDKQQDKVCATSRKYLAYFNAEKLLRQFAKDQALINIEKNKTVLHKRAVQRNYRLFIK
jgi:hypothetical protein